MPPAKPSQPNGWPQGLRALWTSCKTLAGAQPHSTNPLTQTSCSSTRPTGSPSQQPLSPAPSGELAAVLPETLRLVLEAALQAARRAKERTTYPELVQGNRCRLVVMFMEVGGRWSDEAATFLRLLAKARSRAVLQALRSAATQAFLAVVRDILSSDRTVLNCGTSSTLWDRIPKPV